MRQIGIHHRRGSYSEGWLDYCKKQGIPHKTVNAYHSDIVRHLADCDIFMWHHHQGNPKDVLFAKQLLISLEQAGKVVYPNTVSTWHFDDKVGQKYLLESLDLPVIPSFVFYTKREAVAWASQYCFPAVFKLRGGASSLNVRLVRSRREAKCLINRSFGQGFRQYDPIRGIKESLYQYRRGKNSLKHVLKAGAHLFYPYQLEKSKGRERGYAYFQEFIPDCDHDIRIQFIGSRCYAMKRYVRNNDFRASGGRNIDYDGSIVPEKAIEMAFSIADRLNMQTLALDLLPYEDTYQLAEISYAFAVDEGECDCGYWTHDLTWHPGAFNPYGWMIEDLINA